MFGNVPNKVSRMAKSTIIVGRILPKGIDEGKGRNHGHFPTPQTCRPTWNNDSNKGNVKLISYYNEYIDDKLKCCQFKRVFKTSC